MDTWYHPFAVWILQSRWPVGIFSLPVINAIVSVCIAAISPGKRNFQSDLEYLLLVDLIWWQSGKGLCLTCNAIGSKFPSLETWGSTAIKANVLSREKHEPNKHPGVLINMQWLNQRPTLWKRFFEILLFLTATQITLQFQKIISFMNQKHCFMCALSFDVVN